MRLLTLGDKVLITVILGCALLGLFIIPGLRSQGSAAVVTSEHGARLVLRLSEDGTWSVPGPLGETIVEVRDGCVRIRHSPCPHQRCVHMGCRKRDGDIIACIPNGVIIRVQGGDGNRSVDGITR